jgi:hypothetical protein
MYSIATGQDRLRNLLVITLQLSTDLEILMKNRMPYLGGYIITLRREIAVKIGFS